MHLDYLQQCCTGRADGLHPAKIWRTSKHSEFFPALEYRRKLFFAYLLPLLHQIAYFAFFC